MPKNTHITLRGHVTAARLRFCADGTPQLTVKLLTDVDTPLFVLYQYPSGSPASQYVAKATESVIVGKTITAYCASASIVRHAKEPRPVVQLRAQRITLDGIHHYQDHESSNNPPID